MPMPIPFRTWCATIRTTCIPTLWRYYIKNWFQIFFTALFGIIILLLSTKLEEVARFIALGASFSKILFFILLQIPYVLQIALPVAGCAAGFFLFHRMSTNGELVAARAVGYSIMQMLTPLIGISCIGSLLMFGWMFNCAATSHLEAKKLEHDVRAQEPLALMQGSQFLGNQGYSLELEGSLRTGGSAKNMVICFHPSPESRLKLFSAKTVHNKEGSLEADDFLALSTEKPTDLLSPSTLIIEQAKKKVTPTLHINEVIEKKHWKINADHCPLSVVYARKKDLQQTLAVQLYNGEKGKNNSKELGKYTSEPYRRLSLSLAFMTLTLAGALSGIQTRKKSKKEKYLIPIFLFGFYLACYLAGKSMDCLPWPAIVCYLLPHPILLIASWKMKQHAEHCKG
jgi:lipopolysaccharide export system permease protein